MDLTQAAPATLAATWLGVGLLAGGVGGILGLGGGIVIVPALLLLWQDSAGAAPMQLAVGTSLCTIIFTTASATWVHHRRGTVAWPVVGMLVPGLLGGAILGAVLADLLPSATLRRLFGVFELLVAVQLLLPRPEAAPGRFGRVGMALAGGVIGTLSTLMGIGGGTLTIPFLLLWGGVAMRSAVAISSACGVPIAVTGTVAMVVAGWNEPGLPEATLGYIYWPAAVVLIIGCLLGAHLGARWVYRLPVAALRRLFALVLALVGVRMILG